MSWIKHENVYHNFSKYKKMYMYDYEDGNYKKYEIHLIENNATMDPEILSFDNEKDRNTYFKHILIK